MPAHQTPDTAHFLRVVVSHVPSMLAYWDRGLRCRFANQAYQRWFGVDPDKLVGMAMQDLLGPALFALNAPHIHAVLNGQAQEFERTVPGPDGIQRQSLATYTPDTVDGQVVGFVAHVTEVTALKQTEGALHAEAARREATLAQLRDSRASLVEAQRLGGVGNWEWEIATDTTTWSDELHRIFGRDPAQPPPSLAEHPQLYSAESWGRLLAAVEQATRTGQPYAMELQYLRADGQGGWLEARGEAVRAENGHITGLRGTVHEVTLRHGMEEARIKALASEAASRNKTQLLSRISHELRTSLNAILVFSHLFEKDAALPAKHRRWARLIMDAGRHMLTLVEEALDLSAAEAGRIAVAQVDFAPLPVLSECLDQASGAAAAGGITLQGPGPASAAVLVRGDAKRLKQVVDNLVSNAIKYTPPGGTVQLTLSEHGSRVDLVVQDTGPGLTAAQIDRLFVPFERLGAEMTTIPGTGLGLALSKTLVELMGGSIRVHGGVGQGSTFSVTLRNGRRHG